MFKYRVVFHDFLKCPLFLTVTVLSNSADLRAPVDVNESFV